MAGIYIPGMEMPKNCYNCPVRNQGYCGDGMQCSDTKEVVSWHDGHERRGEKCSIVPIHNHGRLIDERWLLDAMITTLEALKKNPKMDGQEMHLIAAFDTLRVMLEDAPTIIPASEEGE